jgi:hypothetical protein
MLQKSAKRPWSYLSKTPVMSLIDPQQAAKHFQSPCGQHSAMPILCVKKVDYLESHAVDGPLSVFDNAPELALPFFQIKVNKRLIGFVRRKMTFLSPKTKRRPPLNPRETCARRGT